MSELSSSPDNNTDNMAVSNEVSSVRELVESYIAEINAANTPVDVVSIFQTAKARISTIIKDSEPYEKELFEAAKARRDQVNNLAKQ
ncbi:hypothetical protein GF376_00885 [Candidatus Peregrinibacteria bacterium]|nr:hypothetical protein [Candidatus Peregrinibacteria bacterium]